MSKGKTSRFEVVILGGGTGGISLAARLRKKLGADKIALIEPSETHDYQPLWTLVGGGIVPKEKSRKQQATLIPRGVQWIQDGVRRVHPAEKWVECTNGARVDFEHLVLATGLQLDFQKIAGLEGNLEADGICSIYRYEGAQRVAQLLRDFRGGHAVFTMPPVPIKCAGAPQKIMYLADEIFRKAGVRAQSKVTFASAGKTIFGVPVFAKAMNEVIERKQIDTLFTHRLMEVRAAEKEAIFETENGPVTVSYDLLHVVPPMSAHAYVRESGLAWESGPHAGWMKVDSYTLQNPDFPYIFGIGDVTGVPNSKTGAAIRKQAPVVARNLLDVIAGRAPSKKYDGYSSCPLVTGRGKVVLAEFGYDGKLMPSFPFDPTKERLSMWWLKRYFLPLLYWKGMLTGRA